MMERQFTQMKIAICDDEPYFIDLISKYCSQYEKEYKIPLVLIKFSEGEKLLYYHKKNKDIDLFILDIMMKEPNGLSIAREIRREGNSSKIVFLTSAIKFAPEGYVIGVSRYWMKPLSYSKFCKEITDLYHQIKKETSLYLIENTGTAIEKVHYDDICFIETKGRKTCVHKINSNYISTTKMVEYEQKLDGRFYRCHAAYIVNMSCIIGIKGMEILLNDGRSVFMSKAKKKKFLAALSSYLCEIN